VSNFLDDHCMDAGAFFSCTLSHLSHPICTIQLTGKAMPERPQIQRPCVSLVYAAGPMEPIRRLGVNYHTLKMNVLWI
jgi:hypothetical protein